jgi:hypothetical protein
MERSPAKTTRRKWATEPTLKEIAILVGVCYSLYVTTIVLLDNYWAQVKGWQDNPTYVDAATAIGHWNIAGIHTWQFWGLPYAMVAFAFVTRTPFLTALLALSVIASIVVLVMTQRLWGGWVAVCLAVFSRDWMERSLLGGAEPLFLALVFGSFLAVRRERWLLASLLASLSTLVRPLGIFALAGIGLVLLFRKQYKTLAAAFLIGIGIAALYIAPQRIYMGNSLANVKAYGQEDGSGGRPLTYPFAALIRPPTIAASVSGPEDVIAGKTTRLSFARSILWIGITVLGIGAMLYNPDFKTYARTRPVESIFCVLYLCLLFTYNSPWARMAFPRYVIPVLPFVFLALKPWLPKDRRLLWGFGLIYAVFAAAETIGILNAREAVRRLL